MPAGRLTCIHHDDAGLKDIDIGVFDAKRMARKHVEIIVKMPMSSSLHKA